VEGKDCKPNNGHYVCQDDPAEQVYSYELRFMGQQLKGGKIVPREMTEEEKAEAEAAKSKRRED